MSTKAEGVIPLRTILTLGGHPQCCWFLGSKSKPGIKCPGIALHVVTVFICSYIFCLFDIDFGFAGLHSSIVNSRIDFTPTKRTYYEMRFVEVAASSRVLTYSTTTSLPIFFEPRLYLCFNTSISYIIHFICLSTSINFKIFI